ncbi:baculoviral IAP repeat-containing protein 7 isoform X3 [Sus scrofa]|nr:baculoviral IAP repeat-containing protein 7 isoform X3 [Sus scrofa]
MEQDESGSPQAGPAAEAPAPEPRDTLLPQGACDTGCHAGPFQKATGPRVPPPGFLAAPPPGASRGQDRACLAAPLLEAKSATVPRQASGVRSPGQTGWAHCRAGCPGAPSPHRTGQGCVFCMGPENRAKCGCCSLKPSPWAAGDSPTQGRHGPRPLCAHSTLSWGGQDHMDGQILSQLRPLAEEEEEAGAGSAPSARPAFPGMGSEELRLASFYDWPLSAVVRPELLAAAGFFHTGQQDKVRCFFCYGGLQSWERGDDPWTEHARWFPRCEFLLQTKGRDFVCSAQESCCRRPGPWLTGSFQDRPEDPEEAGPAAASDAGGSREWAVWSQCPAVQAVLRMGFGRGQVQQLLQRKYHQAVLAGMSTSQLVADLLQEEDRGSAAGARAPAHLGPEPPTSRREAQVQSTREPGHAGEEPGGAQVPREPQGARDAEEQLQRLREERTCRVCLDRAVAVVFVPCGHLACGECAPSLQRCPVCRAPIRSCVRTFLA